MKEIWKKHKGAIAASVIAAVIGACVSNVFTTFSNLHTLNITLKFQHDREILNSTRLSIGFLQNVQTEIDVNASLMQLHNYKASMRLSKDHFSQLEMMRMMAMTGANKPSEAEIKAFDGFTAYAKNIFAPTRRIEELNRPQEPLSTVVWDHGAPEIADIDYEVLRELTEYYLAVHRLNSSITALNATSAEPGGAINDEYADKLEKMIVVNNLDVDRLTEKSVTDLTHKMEIEKQRLHDLRKQYEQSAEK